MSAVSSAARTLAALLSGRDEIAYVHSRGVTVLDSPCWPSVTVVYERASRRPGGGSWVVSWQAGPTAEQMKEYVRAAAEWIGTGRPLRGLDFRYRRELSDAHLALALDRAIAAGQYNASDLDAMAAETGSWARSAAEYNAADLDLREVGPDELADFEALVGDRWGYSMAWLVPLLRQRQARSASAAGPDLAPSTGAGAGDAVGRCAHCGQPMPAGLRSLARYCSAACRQAAHRARATAVMKSRNASCVYCSAPIAEPVEPHRAGRHSLYCSRSCQQRAYRHRRNIPADRDELA